jgi:hypothetical protein
MNFNINYVRTHKVNISILLFLTLMIIVHILKPSFVYERNGSFRQFGLGYKNKTIIPIWIVSIITAILSYLVVSYYVQ